jgi:hypothetical protein
LRPEISSSFDPPQNPDACMPARRVARDYLAQRVDRSQVQVCTGQPARASIGGSMFHLHMPRPLVVVSQSFIGTDPIAWIIAAAAVVTGVLIGAMFFLH